MNLIMQSPHHKPWMTRWVFLALALPGAFLSGATFLGGCAQGAEVEPFVFEPQGTGDSGLTDASDSGSFVCAANTHHYCGSVCVENQENTPDVGCAQGCGTPCPTGLEGEHAYCTPEGLCETSANLCSDLGYECGEQTDQAGNSISCGGCGENGLCSSSGQCVYCTDEFGDSSSMVTASLLGSINDKDYRENGKHKEDPIVVQPRVVAGSSRWFVVDVQDGGDWSKPHPTLEMAGPAGYELAVFVDCPAGSARPECGNARTVDHQDPNGISHKGCETDSGQYGSALLEMAYTCQGSNDARVFIRVTRDSETIPMCSGMHLSMYAW